MKKPAPKKALKLLRWFCHEDHLEEIEGNLLEIYERHAAADRKADWEFYRNVLLHFRPEYIRSFPILSPFNPSDMLKNHFKIALRTITKNKAFSSINIAGLVLGMVCFLLIFLWIVDEKSVDNFHHKGDNLYNIYQNTFANGEVRTDFTTFNTYDTETKTINLPITGIKATIPEVERINFYATGYELPWGHPETFQVGDKIHKLKGSRTGPDFFNMFDYSIIAGNRATPLSDKSSLAISRKMANLFFDTPADAVGKKIRYEDRIDFQITAVFEDVPNHSSLKFDFLINWESQLTRLEWASHRILTTVQLAEGANIPQVEERINQFIQTHLKQEDGQRIEVGLQPYKDQYLVANFANGKPTGGRIEYVNIFSGVAIFILLLACINFMNLSTARSVKRAKEVGVRKVIGSTRSHLIGQFLGESILMSLIALVLAILTVAFLLPSFNEFTGKQISLPFDNPIYWLIAFGLMLITGILAGIYPAFFLASLQPVKVLKGVFQFTTSSHLFRKGLTIFQFSLSIFLLIAAIVVSRQTNFIQQKHLGYDRENLVYIRVEGELAKQNKYKLFKTKALEMPGVAKVDRSSEAPHAMGFVVTDPIQWEGKPKNAVVGFKPSSVGFDFVELMNLEIVEGRGFSNSVATDSATAFLVNEEAVKQMGLTDPIGKWVSAWDKKGNIIGILKDYHTHSLHEPIKPIIIDVKEYEYFGVILVRTQPGATETALASLEQVYREINPNYPFDYQFIDQEYQALYQSEQVISRLSNVFALIAMMVLGLGLLGLAMFAAGQRLKEISVRKVLGASVNQIILLLSKDFIKLIVLSFLIALPLSWYIMQGWLQGFAYRIPLSLWIFAFSGGVVLVLAFLIISSQSLKVAFTNPIDTLNND